MVFGGNRAFLAEAAAHAVRDLARAVGNRDAAAVSAEIPDILALVAASSDLAAADPDTRPGHVEMLQAFATILQRAHRATGQVDALQESVDLLWEASKWVPDTSREAQVILTTYTQSLGELFELRPTAHVVMRLTRFMRRPIPGRRSRDALVDMLYWAGGLRERVEGGGPADICQEVVELMRIVVAETPDTDPQQPGHESSLAEDLVRLADCGGPARPELVAEAVRHARNAVARERGPGTSAGVVRVDHEHSRHLAILSNALNERYQTTGNLGFLDESIEAARNAVAATPRGDRDLHSHLAMLATALQRRFVAATDGAALAESVSVHERAITAMAGFDLQNAPRLYSNYAGALTQLAVFNRSTADLVKAVEIARTAVAMAPENHPRRFIYLTTLGTALSELARAGRDDSLWPEATTVLKQALAAAPPGHPGRATIQSHLARLLQGAGSSRKDAATLRAAVQQARDAVNGAAGNVAGQRAHLEQLADVAFELFTLTGESQLLAEGVAADRASLADRDVGPADLVRMATLMLHLPMLYRRTHEPDLLHESIELGTRLLAATPANAGLRSMIEIQIAQAKAILGDAGTDPAKAGSDSAKLDEALATARAVANVLPSEPAGRAVVVFGAIDIFKKVSASHADPALLAEALDFIDAAKPSFRTDASGQARLTADRAVCIAELYKMTRRSDLLPDLRAACATAADVATARGGTQTELVGITLAELFHTILPLTGGDDDLELLDAAVRVGRAAAQATASDDLTRSARLADLVTALEAMARTRAGEAIRAEAIDAARAAVAATDADTARGHVGVGGDARSAARRLDLSKTLRSYFAATGDVAMLTEAETVGREALAARPQDIGSLLALSLTLTLVARYRDSEVSAEAIDLARAAIAAAGSDDRGRGSLYNGLGGALQARFEVTMDVSAAVEAIDAFRIAIDYAVTRDNRAGFVQNLANMLRSLYDLQGDSELLREAVELGRGAADSTAVDHPEYSRRRSLSATTIYKLYERTGDSSLLTEALDAIEDALDRSDTAAPDYPAYLTAQGAMFREMFKQAGDWDALVAAMEALEESVRRTPIGHVSRALRLANLASILDMAVWNYPSVESGRDPEEKAELIVRAVDVAAEAVAATPDDHPALAGYLITLGRSTLAAALTGTVGKRAAQQDDLNRVRDIFRRAATHEAALPRTRLEAYGFMLNLGGLPPGEAMRAVDEAVALLPLLADRSLSRTDREYNLAEHKGSLSTQFASLALFAGRPERAVEILEQTRGILVADRLGLQSTDMSRLEAVHPDLSRELRAATERLDGLEHAIVGASTADTAQDPSGEQRRLEARRFAAFRQETLAEHTRVLAGIRAIDGFQDFLKPRFADLAALAVEGPVVSIYADAEEGVALILDAGSPDSPRPVPLLRSIQLPDLTARAVGEQVEILLAATDIVGNQGSDVDERVRAQAEIASVLRWLWEAAVRDVLDALGFDDPLPDDVDASSARRLWWCPVGALAFLPLHAAGHHEDLADDDPAVRANPRTALDRVVSSYTPTLQSLAFARSRVPDAALRGTVAVAVAEAEGMPLPSADAEAEAVGAALPNVRILTEPTRDDVMSVLPQHLTAHFACHGVAFADPGASRLILADHRENPLTVADLRGLRLSTGLAYLSACETSLSSPELVDEAVHLTGAFHLAGYRHVIGTLWPIGAFASKALATDFYQRLTPDRAEPLPLDGTAHALHSALRVLRSRFPKVPSAWAGHVHFGP